VKTIERKMKALGERLERLEQLCKEFSSFNEYQASLDAKDIAERNLQVAIEACLDIGKIIISAKKLNEPKDNKGIFVVLAEGGIISHKSLDFLLPMAGARNILVHGYDKVDDGLIYGVIKSHLDDFATFLREIMENYLKSSAKEEK